MRCSVDLWALVQLVLVAVAVGVAALNVSRMKVFQWLREELLVRAWRAQANLRARVDGALEGYSNRNGVYPPDAERRYQLRRRMPWSVWLYYLVSCPYCFGHYVSAAAVAIFRITPLTTEWRPLDFGVAWLLTVFFGILVTQAVFRALGDGPDVVNLQADETFEAMPKWVTLGTALGGSVAGPSKPLVNGQCRLEAVH